MEKFYGKEGVDFRRVVAIAFEMVADHGLQRFGLDIWPGQTSTVEQHFLNVIRKTVAVPNTKMRELVPA